MAGGYDSLNRLTAAAASVGTAMQYQCWGYDSFGNRTAAITSSQPLQTPCPTAGVQSASSAIYSYDTGGHNHIISVIDGSGYSGMAW